jgi:hypothetical protein
VEVILFTAVAAALYFAADRLLLLLESRAGRRFEHRSLLFFAMLLALAVVTFRAIQKFWGPG